jgi:hypothetical protein
VEAISQLQSWIISVDYMGITEQMISSTYFDLDGHHTYVDKTFTWRLREESAAIQWVVFGNGSVVPFHFSYWWRRYGDEYKIPGCIL